MISESPSLEREPVDGAKKMFPARTIRLLAACHAVGKDHNFFKER
jgi:hypothetical protein